MKRISYVGALVVLAVIAGAALSSVSHGDAAGPGRSGTGAPPTAVVRVPATDSPLAHLTPKSSLQVIKGIKTVAPAVPPPVTRQENNIVEYDLTVRETSGQIAPHLNYL